MKHIRKNLDQQDDSQFGNSLEGALGESDIAPPTPPRGVGEPNGSLLYLSCFNSDNEVDNKRKKGERKPDKKTRKRLKKGDIGWKGDDWTPNNKEYKIMKSLRENIKHWAKVYGTEKLFFLTLTFKDNVKDAETARKRFNNFNRQFSRLSKVKWLYKGVEPQKSGRLHFHIVGHHQSDLGGQSLDWDAYKKSNEARSKGDWGNMYKYQRIMSKSANEELHEMWGKVRNMAKGSGFGRSEFLPVRSANSIGQYVGKYLGKCFASQNNGEWCKGLRRFSYSRSAPQVHGRQFSWAFGKHGPEGSPTWREKVAVWAYAKGVKDEEDMARKYGKRWAITNKDEINYFGLVWRLDRKAGKPFGYLAPSVYPTGVHRSPLENMQAVAGDRSLADPFEISESEMFDKWIGNKQTGKISAHARHLKKWQRAEKEKRFNERIYGG